MLDDYGDEFNIYFPVNTGRIFHDGDHLSHRISNSAWKTKNAIFRTPDIASLPIIMDNTR